MMATPLYYSPYSARREVGATITVASEAARCRENASAAFTDPQGFTPESDAAGLIDGAFGVVSAQTLDTEASKAVKVSFSAGWPPELVIVCFERSGELPRSITVEWRQGEYMSIQSLFLSSIRPVPLSGAPGVAGYLFEKPSSIDKPDTLTVNFGSTSGVRITQLIFSRESEQGLIITRNELCSLEITEQVDVTARRFLPRRLEAEFLVTDGILNSPDLSGRMLHAFIEINGSTINAGEFYIDSVTKLQNGLKYRIEASDLVAKMARNPSALSYNQPVTVREILTYRPGAAAGFDYIVDDYSLDAYVFPSMITDIDSQRDCLLMMSQAARASSIWIDRTGRVRISCIQRKKEPAAGIPADGITAFQSDSLGPKYLFAKVFGKNPYGDVCSYSGAYQVGSYAQVLKNNYIAYSESKAVADNFLAGLNMRRRLVIQTRCDPAIEAGDWVTVMGRDGKPIGDFVVASQKMRVDDKGLSAIMVLVK